MTNPRRAGQGDYEKLCGHRSQELYAEQTPCRIMIYNQIATATRAPS